MHTLIKPFRPCADWLKTMLQQRGLQSPDGRPLYRYRLSEAEFDSLAQMLRERCAANANTPDAQPGFAACWFLLAAEWWKRCYEGGAWAWAPICLHAGIRAEVTPAQRSGWVNDACRYWQLCDRIEGGKHYLGRVVANGGLPLRLISEAGGSVSRLLHIVQLEIVHSRLPMSEAQILAAVAERARLLPASYRQTHVLELLTEVLMTVRRLNNEIRLADSQDPVAWLDQTHPGWLNEFPLQLEEAHARSLLGGLVRQAHQGATQQRHFQIIRQLRFDSAGQPTRLEVLLETSGRINEVELLELLGRSAEEQGCLPAAMDLVAMSGGVSRQAGRLTRRDGIYQILAEGAALPSSWLQQDIELQLSRFGECLGQLDLPGGDAPDENEPWVFADTQPVSRLLTSGSARLREASCLIAVPPRMVSFTMEQDPVALGACDGRSILRAFAGELHLSLGKDSWQVRCADPSARESGTLVWHGLRVAHCQSQPARVYRGQEAAFEYLPTGERRRVPRNELFWQREQGELCPLDACRASGIGWLIWKRDGQIRSRARAVCLPENASIELMPAKEASQHDQIILRDWPASSVSAVSDLVEVLAENDGADWVLHCRSLSDTPPVSLTLAVRWQGGRMQRLTVPYPAEGAFLYRDSGEVRRESQALSVADLHGLNIRLQSIRPRRWQIELALQDCQASRVDIRTLPVTVRPGESVVDLRLFELQNDVRQLLAAADELDAKVRISVRRDGSVCRTLLVGRYRDHLIKTDRWVELVHGDTLPADEALKSTRMLAIPMLEPEMEACQLEAHQSELANTGRWAFDPDRFKPGVWLIYPAEGASLDCRPIAWYVDERFAGPPRSHNGLRAAMAKTERAERLEALQSQFEIMACDPDHADWCLVEHYIRQLGHLPLAGLDLWVALIHSPRAVIMALLQVEGFAERIAHRLNSELPFEWLLTAPQDWLDVLSALMVSHQTEDEGALRRWRRALESKLEWLRRLYPALELSIALALSRKLDRKQAREVELLIQSPEILRSSWIDRLLSGESSDVQGLLQRTSQSLAPNESGPTALRSYAAAFAHSSSGGLLLKQLNLPPDDWKYSLVVVPMAVAYDIAGKKSPDWLKNRGRLVALRNYRNFDSHWFDEAYKVAMVCAFDDGLITV